MDIAHASRKRILLIDDNFLTREALSMLLTGEGYMVAAAANGEEALRRLRGCGPVDLILLDLAMPVMDGEHFRAAQRECPDLANIPVVVFSGCEPSEGQAVALGAAGWLRKPVPTPELLATVRRCSAAARVG
jgi:CheY-like chemotaxis protein